MQLQVDSTGAQGISQGPEEPHLDGPIWTVLPGPGGRGKLELMNPFTQADLC